MAGKRKSSRRAKTSMSLNMIERGCSIPSFFEQGNLRALGEFEGKDIKAIENLSPLNLEVFEESQREGNDPGPATHVGAWAGLVKVESGLWKIMPPERCQLEIITGIIPRSSRASACRLHSRGTIFAPKIFGK